MTFEEKLKKMEEISEKLKDEKTSLEESIKLYEEGMKISKEADKELSSFQRRVEIVTSSSEDGVIKENFNN